MQTTIRLAALAALVALTACEKDDLILPGQREGLREVLGQQPEQVPPMSAEAIGPRAAGLAPAQRNGAWLQSHVTPTTRVAHPMLSVQPTQIWAANIGQGDKRRARLIADPVASNGRIFTMDSAATVTATATNGETLWQADLTPVRDRSDDTAGGGLAIGDGKLFVTSAFGTVTALDPATGQQIWQQDLGATGTGAPAYYDGLVYLVAGDTTAWAIEAKDGRVRWQIDGVADVHNVAGGASPAITDQRVYFSFGSADVQAAFRRGGLTLWTSSLAGERTGRALSVVDDITGDPVVVGDVVYAGNFAGRSAAFDAANGERIWTANHGAAGPAWPAGDSIYMVTDLNELVRMDAKTGATLWSTDLPGYVPKRRPHARRETSYTNLGPIVAGGRVVVASSDGLIRLFDPETGALTASVPIAGGATTAPIVVDGTLYVVSSKGVLHAFR
ncbi:PQQ-like beta-propeller repeat protein [Pseudoprimorskyibacter insulae]|uniref:Outer membrane protein assembly factor BamB n=1 Tax=Pseudoprimorskyibacter insulae TaxID=1695997 RepID=A0A2R8AXW8_9RHOB|nr:PQQ-like beta-propeller repeat protein [Pseudoprimorskyibacter insulae]SPF80885.1 Outer membrane protein assembly factor BamB [Pseudoprimorskyibacter insulae]